jgi:predicted Zn-dependent protease
LPELLDIATRALRHADGDDALVSVVRERSLLLRFAANRPTQATAVDDLTVETAVVRAGHVGRASANDSGDGALAACARRAAAAADAAAATYPPGRFPGFRALEPHRRHEGHDPATAALEPAAGGRALSHAFAIAESEGVEAHGIWTAGEEQRAVVARAGGAAEDRTTDSFMKVICIAPGGRSGYAARASVAAGRLDASSLARRAAAKANWPGEPAAVAPGEHPVVFEAHAVGTLLEVLGGSGFDGLAHAEGRGALSGRLGQRVAAPSVNLSDSPRFAATLQRGIDAEGTPKAPVPLIQDGVAHGVVHDTRSAALLGARSTGHAAIPGGHPEGPRPANLVMIGGGAPDEADLCVPIERGLYVTRLWYANDVRPKESLVTAVTRDGTFLIEDGRISRPAHDLRLTDSVLGLLSRTEALGSGQELVSEAELYGRRAATAVACPPLRVRAARFTDTAGGPG